MLRRPEDNVSSAPQSASSSSCIGFGPDTGFGASAGLGAASHTPLSIALRHAAHRAALRQAAQRPDARLASLDHYWGDTPSPRASSYTWLSARLREQRQS